MGASASPGKHAVKMDYRLNAVTGEEVAKEALNYSFSDDDGPSGMTQKTA